MNSNLIQDIARIGRIPEWRVEEILREAEQQQRENKFQGTQGAND